MERNLKRRQRLGRGRADKLGGFGTRKEGEEEEEDLGFNIPKEVEVEIMRRLPIKSLMRLRRVSKSWKSLIESNYFINKHLLTTAAPNNNNNDDRLVAVLGLLNHEVHVLDKASSLTKKLFRFDTPGENRYSLALSFIGTYNGLICIQAMTDPVISDSLSTLGSCTVLVYLWNPVRRETKTIDRRTFRGFPGFGLSRRDFINYGFGYDSRNSDYKVVRLEHDRSSKSCIVKKVYSLNTDSWKLIPSTPPSTCYPRPYQAADRPPLPFVNGATHWLADSTTNFNDDHGVVISYDFSGEVFGVIPLPSSSSDKGSLVSYKSLLAFMVPHLDDTSVASPGKLTFHLWVMREYGVAESWTKLYTIDSPTLNGLRSPVDLEFRGFGEDENEHVFSAEVADTTTQLGGATIGLYFVKSCCNSSRPTFTSSSSRLLYHSRNAITFRPSLVSFYHNQRTTRTHDPVAAEKVVTRVKICDLRKETKTLEGEVKDIKLQNKDLALACKKHKREWYCQPRLQPKCTSSSAYFYDALNTGDEVAAESAVKRMKISDLRKELKKLEGEVKELKEDKTRVELENKKLEDVYERALQMKDIEDRIKHFEEERTRLELQSSKGIGR